MFNTDDNLIFDNNNLTAAFEANNDPLSLDVAANNTAPVGRSIGTLSADNFVIDRTQEITVISGNGNVDFGEGLFDNIDLSDVSVEAVVNYNPATIDGGGVVIDPGDGARVFDYIALADGREILFEGIDRVTFADGIEDLTVTPNDPLFDLQSNLHITGVHNAWRFTQGSNDVLIGVKDTGLAIDANGDFHPDIRRNDTLFFNGNNIGLRGNLADDLALADGQVQPTSHGTSVNGIIGAGTDNGEGIAGINWNSEIYNIDILGGDVGDLGTAVATQEAINTAKGQGQQLVINLSIQVNDSFDVLNPIHNEFYNVVANNPDVLFVVSSGNFGNIGREGLSSPAILAREFNNVIAVGAAATDTNSQGNPVAPGTRLEFSQFGEGLTVVAPGDVPSVSAAADGEFSYDFFNGTSAAAPHVTGIASLVWSANRDLTAAEVKQIISETAYDLGAIDYDLFTGHGMINADAAVRKAIALGRESTTATV